MSHEATDWAFKQRGLKPSAKLVLMCLADRHNPDWGCFPAQDTLAADCEMSERSVRDQIKILENANLIRRVRAIRRGGKYQSDRYLLAFEADFADGKATSKPAASLSKNQRQNLPPNPVKGTSNRTGKAGKEQFNQIFREDWQPSESDQAWARDRGFSNEQIRNETEKLFYCLAGRSFSDLSGRWRLWMLKSKEFRSRETDRSEKSSQGESWLMHRVRRRIEAEDARR